MNNRYSKVKEKLNNNGIIIIDGGTGTELQKRGVPMSDAAWCGTAAIEHTDILKQIHFDYISAGAEIIAANTYASNRIMLETAGVGDQFETINLRAIKAAQLARKDSKNDNILVAGSLGHRLPIEVGKQEASIKISGQKLEEVFSELAELLKKGQCDLIILEMMYHPERILPAFNAAKKTGMPVWAGFSVREDKNGNIVNWTNDGNVPFVDTVQILNDFDIEAAGIMHSSISVIEESINILKENFDGPIMAYPDSGGWNSPNWEFENVISPSELLDFAKKWKKNGTQIFGGCCGLSPEHIHKLNNLRD